MAKETRVFTIIAEPVLLARIERFLALLHFNSGFGHSGLFAMSLDGDGSEKVKVDGLSRALGYEVEAIGGVGYDVEIAHNASYGGRFIDRSRASKWTTGPSASLYKDGEIVKTIPSRDWTYDHEVEHTAQGPGESKIQGAGRRANMEASGAMGSQGGAAAQSDKRNAS